DADGGDEDLAVGRLVLGQPDARARRGGQGDDGDGPRDSGRHQDRGDPAEQGDQARGQGELEQQVVIVEGLRDVGEGEAGGGVGDAGHGQRPAEVVAPAKQPQGDGAAQEHQGHGAADGGADAAVAAAAGDYQGVDAPADHRRGGEGEQDPRGHAVAEDVRVVAARGEAGPGGREGGVATGCPGVGDRGGGGGGGGGGRRLGG